MTDIDLRLHASKISEIINGLIKIGFEIEIILESEPLEKEITSDEDWKDIQVFKIIPSTLICKALKVLK